MVRLADLIDTSVSELLGSKITVDDHEDHIAERLAMIAEEMAKRNRRTKVMFRVVIGLVVAMILIPVITTFAASRKYSALPKYTETTSEDITEEAE